MRRATASRRALPAALLLVTLPLAGCTGDENEPTSPQTPTSSEDTASGPTGATPTGSATASAAPGTVPPSWLGTRELPRTATGYGEVRDTPRELAERRFTLPDTVPALPGDGFASKIVDPAPAAVVARSTWRPACPVDRAELAWVRLTFRGFDGERHTGELLVNRAVAREVVGVFERLWEAEFPMERMRIATRADLDAAPTGDGNDTGAFVCRPVTGGTRYSDHAYGTAIDINPFQNPYVRRTGDGEVVLPELASAYLDRDRVRPGMILADGPVVAAFAEIGWGWGGAWRSSKDYQHFSRSGR